MRVVPAACASFALLASGCFMDHEVPPDPPIEDVEVAAVISGATLGDDCPGEGITDGDADFGACAEDAPCPSLCQQSNVQLAITTSAGEVPPLTFEVLRVTLHDHASGDALEELSWRSPRAWDDELGYVEWDELLPAPSELSVSYDLSAPAWGSLTGRIGSSLWSQPFQLRMLVRIDGEERELRSDAIYRVSDIDT